MRGRASRTSEQGNLQGARQLPRTAGPATDAGGLAGEATCAQSPCETANPTTRRADVLRRAQNNV